MALLAGGGVATWAVLDDSPYDATPPGRTSEGPRPAAAAVAVQDLATALADRDAEAAASLAPSGDASAADLLRAVAHNARVLGLTVGLRYVDETEGVEPGAAWTAAVAATWRYAGDSGHEPARAEVDVQLQPEGDRVAVAGFGRQGSGRLPVWLSGPVVVVRAPRVLAVVAGEGAVGRSEARRYVRLASTAVQVVHRVLPRWHDRLVVEVPASSAAVDRALDADPGHTQGIAAVTAPVDGSVDTDSPVHVFVNPDVFDRLRPTGAQVVISHEAVHVATGAARSDLAPWLLEGFADYVALRDVALPLRTSAGQIIREVRRSGVPEALPGPADFATGARHLGATYESAWLACVVLVDAGGERALVGLYHDASSGIPMGKALRQRFGFTEAALTRRWQHRLRVLAG